jgi:hypothetical protein
MRSYLTRDAILVGTTGTPGSAKIPTNRYAYIVIDVEVFGSRDVLVGG